MIENKDADEESQKDSVEAEDNKETKLSFQLQSSDFDFLEQISTKTTESQWLWLKIKLIHWIKNNSL